MKKQKILKEKHSPTNGNTKLPKNLNEIEHQLQKPWSKNQNWSSSQQKEWSRTERVTWRHIVDHCGPIRFRPSLLLAESSGLDWDYIFRRSSCTTRLCSTLLRVVSFIGGITMLDTVNRNSRESITIFSRYSVGILSPSCGCFFHLSLYCISSILVLLSSSYTH